MAYANNYLLFVLALLIAGCQSGTSSDKQNTHNNKQNTNDTSHQKGPITLVIHGGAGGMDEASMSEEEQAIWKQKLKTALDNGYTVLEDGGKAMEAVRTAIQTMENDSFFNAGKGSVLTHQGKVEMDASIMRGKNKNAGAVAGVTTIKNPIKAAKAVMTNSKHVMLAREGAEKFAREQGLTQKPEDYFITKRRYESLQEHLEEGQTPEGKDGVPADKMGTVGAVALDQKGNLAAGTSTGGMTNKKFGRIGDSPIIGAATYADNTACAISATGHGEYFIRNVVAYDVNAHMKYQDMPLTKAMDTVIHHQLENLGGSGGIIGLDRQGHYHATFNSDGMFRAFKQKGEAPTARIF